MVFKNILTAPTSVVSGQLIKPEPAKATRPIRFPASSSMIRFSEFLAFSSRLGVRSSASILLETSMAIITSMPICPATSVFLPHCGLASARIKNKTASANSPCLMTCFLLFQFLNIKSVNSPGNNPAISFFFLFQRNTSRTISPMTIKSIQRCTMSPKITATSSNTNDDRPIPAATEAMPATETRQNIHCK